MTEKKMKITFAPGAFDSFDGTQEELDALIAEVQRMADSGELAENSVALEDWDDLDDEDIDDVDSIDVDDDDDDLDDDDLDE